MLNAGSIRLVIIIRLNTNVTCSSDKKCFIPTAVLIHMQDQLSL